MSDPTPQTDKLIQTRLTERFQIKHPILCAPMGFITGGALAAAVSHAGGLGIVGGGYAGTVAGDLDLDAELTLAKSGKFGVGFIGWALSNAPTMLAEALQHSPFCVFLSFSDPRPFAEQIHQAGAVLICQIQSLSQIDMALEAGAAVVVAQGTEAGGHAGSRSTLAFVPEVADYLNRRSPETLLLAAGGIGDGRGLAAALMLGADGVVVGTRFWASIEALTPKSHTDKAFASNGDSTVRTKFLDALRGLSWPQEYSFRFLQNKLTNQWAAREHDAFRAFGQLAQEYAEARARGDLDTVAVVCGEIVGLIEHRPPAEEIVNAIVQQAARLLRNGSALDFTSPRNTAPVAHS